MTDLRLRLIGRVLAAAAVAVASLSPVAGPAIADEGFFIGDSIAAGAASAIGIKGIGRPSISLRRTSVTPQFARIPNGAVGLMSLGVNDAADPVDALRKDIEKVIEAAQKSGKRIVWIGPPCVLRNWDGQAKLLDDYLRERLATTSIQYVSLRDPQMCQPAMRTKDGAHFTPAGYQYVWQKIQRDSTFAALVEVPKKRDGTTEVAATERATDAPKAPDGPAATPEAVTSPASTKGPDADGSKPRRGKGAKDANRPPQQAAQQPPGQRGRTLKAAKAAPKSNFGLHSISPNNQ